MIKKAEKKNIFKSTKIKKIYSNFKSIILKNIKGDKFAVAVSGGSDSLCLTYLSKIFSDEFKTRVYFLIVDHKLRKESKKEATVVSKLLNKKNIKSQILNWQGKTPKSNIQSNARNIRYSLMSDFCFEKKIKYLLTAHHLDDQIENFFIRLSRGSGLTGLSSMPEIVSYNKNLKIVRPLLGFKKEELKYITINYFKTYIKDPSNKNDKFLRVRIRKYRDIMKKEGLDTNKIIKTINNLLSADQAIDYYKNKALHKHVNFISKNKCLVNKKIFIEEADEVIFKSFSVTLSLIAGTYYPPRSKKVLNLINRLKKNQFSKSTLGGCIIEKKESTIIISKESKVNKMLIHAEK